MKPRTSIMAISSALFLSVSALAQESSPQANADNASSPETYITSTEEAYAAMQALPMDQTIQMLNLVRFKEVADYSPESGFADKGWTGEEAYAEYGRNVSPILSASGGEPIYSGTPQLSLIGPEHEKWDAVFIIEYPNVQSFLGFVSDPDYVSHAFHRTAAIADSRLIRMTPLEQ